MEERNVKIARNSSKNLSMASFNENAVKLK